MSRILKRVGRSYESEHNHEPFLLADFCPKDSRRLSFGEASCLDAEQKPKRCLCIGRRLYLIRFPASLLE